MSDMEWEPPLVPCVPKVQRIGSETNGEVVLRDPSEVINERKREADLVNRIEGMNKHENDGLLGEITTLDEDEANILSKVAQMKVKEQTIQHTPPGEDILDLSLSCNIFSADSLSLSKFVDNVGSFGKYILPLDNEELYKVILNKSFESKIFAAESVNSSVCLFLFYAMSVHPDGNIVEACLGHLAKQKDYFVLNVNDVITVLVNWGFKLNGYIPGLEIYIPEYIQTTAPVHIKSPVSFYNMEKVLDFLCYPLSYTPFTTSEVQCLLQIFLLMELEKKLSTTFAVSKCSDCVHILMSRISRENWTSQQIESLVKILHFKDIHFHNQVKISSNLLGPSQLSVNVSLALGYATMQQLLHRTDIHYISHLNILHLWELVQEIKDFSDISYYEEYYVFKLLHHCVWCMPIQLEEKKYLDLLLLWVCAMGVRVPNDIASLDPTVIKELISFMKSTWRMKNMNFISQDSSDVLKQT